VKEHKFAEMSTWQQELYVQVRVQVLQNYTRVQVGLPTSTKYASEAITISTTNCRRLKFFAVSDNEKLTYDY